MPRPSRHFQLTIGSNEDTTDSFKPVDGVFGMVSAENLFGAVLTPEVKIGKDSNWCQVIDSGGNVVTMPMALGKASRIPDACFPCSEMRFVSDQEELAEPTLYVLVSG